MLKKINKTVTFVSLLFAALLGWWISINLRSEVSTREVEAFSDSIWIIAFSGGAFGLVAAKKWGGFKSVFGRAISFFSLGLISQALGQFVYIYYAYALDNSNPYPSLADVFFFGTIPLYVLALFNLARALNIRFSKTKLLGKLAAIAIPAGLLGFAYATFLQGYEKCYIDEETSENICASGVQVFLDFAYPLGGAVYIAIAILILVLSLSILGGKMKNKILFLLFGLLTQYLAEFHYLYVTSKDSLVLGGLNDLLYLTAYFLVSISIINIGQVIDEILGATKIKSASGAEPINQGGGNES